MYAQNQEFALAGSLDDLKAKGRIVVHGSHRPILVVYDRGRVFALDNRCPHMGFPLERGSIEDGILTCRWHHARFDLESGCTFDLWADDVPICPVEIRNGEVMRALGLDASRLLVVPDSMRQIAVCQKGHANTDPSSRASPQCNVCWSPPIAASSASSYPSALAANSLGNSKRNNHLSIVFIV